jgi:hypothetical protein
MVKGDILDIDSVPPEFATWIIERVGSWARADADDGNAMSSPTTDIPRTVVKTITEGNIVSTVFSV